jgi:hypothetical protein
MLSRGFGQFNPSRGELSLLLVIDSITSGFWVSNEYHRLRNANSKGQKAGYLGLIINDKNSGMCCHLCSCELTRHASSRKANLWKNSPH